MNKKEISEKLYQWLIEFVEVPNSKLNNWPPCPFARQARINNDIEIKFSDAKNLSSDIREVLHLLDNKEVVIICFDHTQINCSYLKGLVYGMNDHLMKKNYVILEDHPDCVEYVNDVKMNFDMCGLLIIQKLDKLNIASKQLKDKGYYNNWSQKELDEVVTWRAQ